MSSTRKNQRKALVALALGFATAAIFATTASAGLGTGPIPGQYPDLEAEQALIQSSSSIPSASAAEVDAGQLEPNVDTGIIPGQYSPDLEAEQALIQASTSPSTSAAEVDAGQLEPNVDTGIIPGQYSPDLEAEQALIQASSSSRITSPLAVNAGHLERGQSAHVPNRNEISYLSWGATAADLGPFKASLANQSTRDGGPVFMNGVPDGYVGSGVEQQNLSGEGVTPTNLARAYHSVEQGVAQPDGYQPRTKTVENATVSASSDGLDRGDLALGFGLGLILATACAIAVAMTRDRQRTRMAHS